MDMQQTQALIRFGLGRRGTQPPPADPRAWLAAQLRAPDIVLAQPPATTSADGLAALRADRRTPLPEGPRTRSRAILAADFAADMDILLTTDAPFRERLVWFWANHFTVSLRRFDIAPVAGAYVREAIRPHVTGRFADMLLAVMRHPAMLMYLDNIQSVGPDSPAGQRSQRGLNENLARECLELHTITPAAGYTQQDVTAFAAILTGWTIDMQAASPGFVFRPNAHEPGTKTLLGRPFPPGGAGGLAALAFLAAHPATRRNLATKLVRHFIADQPPPDAVRRIEIVLNDTDGDLLATSLALIGLDQAWTPLTKLRSPSDYLVAVLRALDLPAEQRPPLTGLPGRLGQPYMTAPLPNGWPDTAADWAAPEAMMQRIDLAYMLAGRDGLPDAADLAQTTLGPLLPPATLARVRGAGSRRDAMTLALTLPEFNRR